MKTTLMFLMLLITAAIGAKAQSLIAVQNGKAPKFYTKLPDAISNALAGDTVYIPGGSFDAITIDKRLYVIGVGHNPDSTSATARTMISGVTLTTGADNGLITGVLLGGSIPTILLSGTINNYTISRCNFYTLTTLGSVNITNFSIIENIVNGFNLPGTNHLITNNIVTGAITANYSIVRNNIFLYVPQSAGLPYSLYAINSVIENNIVEQYGWSGPIGVNNTFNNNVNVYINGVVGTNQGSGNFSNAGLLKTVFVSYDQAANGGWGDGVYKADFNLALNSPYKKGGTDGTDVGIYGGAFPWKPGSIPFNPHLQSVKIAPKTDASGNLKVQITVAAQNN